MAWKLTVNGVMMIAPMPECYLIAKQENSKQSRWSLLSVFVTDIVFV
jgi:hypothetical protein